jgi:hypothetical protein
MSAKALEGPAQALIGTLASELLVVGRASKRSGFGHRQ